MVINPDGNIVFIEPNELRFVNPSNNLMLGYQAGLIERGDIILWVERGHSIYKDLFPYIKDNNYIGIQNSDDNVVVLFSFGNPDIQPVIKICENKTGLSTIFCGHEIEIGFDMEDRIPVSFDMINYTTRYNQNNTQMIVFSESRMKFFISNRQEDVNLEKIIATETYKGHINLEALGNAGLRAEALLAPLLYQKITTLARNVQEHEELAMEPFHWEGVSVELRVRQFSDKSIEIMFFHDEAIDQKIEALFQIKSKILNDDSAQQRNDNSLENEFPTIISSSYQMKELKFLIKRVATTNASVLILGESGTGKTLIAHEIHMKSKRASKPFVYINCAAIPDNLIESELFGYEEGAFTGAKKSGREGYFEIADTGTLFLDEIGELPLSSQSRLLEVLQNYSFYRIGGNKKVNVDVRIIAATNQDIERQVAEKTFRSDLFYRLNVFPIRVPPLRERPDDVEPLSKKLLPRICSRLEVEPLILSSEAIRALRKHGWPGNVRELENTLEQAAILCEGRVIEKAHLNFATYQDPEIKQDLKSKLELYEKRIIESTLAALGNSKILAAQELGLGRTTLFTKMKKYNIEV